MRWHILSLWLLAACGALIPRQTQATIIAYDDPARWGAAAQFFTTENFDGVTPEQLPSCTIPFGDDCGAGTFVLTDFHIQTQNSDLGWFIGPGVFGGGLEGVFRCVQNQQGGCYFDIIFDRPISAIGLYLEDVTFGNLVVPPAGIDVFVGASASGIGPGFYPPDTEPFLKPDTDPFLGLVSDTAFSQIHFVLHDVPVPPTDFNFADRSGYFTLSRVDYRLVPEPATLALLAAAFAGMGWARRRA